METEETTADGSSGRNWENYRPPRPDTSHLITETEEPVDIFSEKQRRLLTEALYASWNPGRPFWVAANVGMYEALNARAVVPDVFLSLDTTVDRATEFGSKCYFFWDHGKPPEVVVEIVSNKGGGELEHKLERYAKLHVDHYVVFDPQNHLSSETLRAYVLFEGEYQQRPHSSSYSTVEGLELALWEGEYEDQSHRWLRWTEPGGMPFPTGRESAAAAAEKADAETKRADAETERANAEARRAEALAARLRELGGDPDSVE